MSEMVERVAGAIEAALNADRSLYGTESKRAARAAIKAMRKPITYAMRVAAVNTALPGIGEPPLYEKIWQAMIVAALSPSREDEGK